ncbi:MAG: 30S ribosomal protein S1 [Gammaproteobacteria bacterium RIFCSPHIGHO2_12_FULL_35_23]|nr:MAG: 30S ribosomal protein S1 [Gammaproteobacteria bacterium RIFCSPHIGHO2_12_FULL_35_23]
MKESFAELFEQSSMYKRMRAGDVLKGIVEKIGKDYIAVNVGLKSEGIVPTAQFMDDNNELEVKVGDQIDVVVEAVEDGSGETRLSREKAKRAAAWINLEKIYESSTPVMGLITGKVKGGFTVEVQGVRAFLPGSLVDVRPVRDTSYIEGKKLEFKVIKMDHKRNNVVVSRRAVVEQEMASERTGVLENMEEGQIIKGIVKNLTDYGAFVDLGGVDGLLHITDMSWKRIKHPSEIINIGDEIDVRILKFDREKGRVSLGLKQLGDDPWADFAERYPSGKVISGHVTNITDYGCFVEIEPGIEGLVHMSEMDWTNKNIHPNKVVQLGDEVEAMILEVNEERRRISLGMKQCQPNPWQAFASAHKVGEKVKGAIKSITDFGVFIGLTGNIDGLIHLSDISSEAAQGEAMAHDYKKGQEIEAVILSIDAERERIALGVKQLGMDTFDLFVDTLAKSGNVKGKVIAVDSEGVRVELAPEVLGMILATEVEGEPKAGEEILVRITGVDKSAKQVQLSMKSPAKKAKVKKAETSENKEAKKTTLGDLIRAKMEEGGGQENE